MASGTGAAEHALAKVAEGIVDREARAALKEAEQIGTRDAVNAGEREAGRAVSPPRLDRTEPTGAQGGTPTGRPAKVGKGDADSLRGCVRENEAAGRLAARGYTVCQNPTPAQVAAARRAVGDLGRDGTKPDYLVEGRVFDCYSPAEATSVRNIAGKVADKIENGQTQRVVVNLADWDGSMSDLTDQFGQWPIPGLKELVVLPADGSILHLFAE